MPPSTCEPEYEASPRARTSAKCHRLSELDPEVRVKCVQTLNAGLKTAAAFQLLVSASEYGPSCLDPQGWEGDVINVLLINTDYFMR